MKKIRQRGMDLRGLKLSPEEGFVLSRVDGTTTVKDLVALTGLDEGRIVDIVGRLTAEGAVEIADQSSSRLPGDAGPPSSSRMAAATPSGGPGIGALGSAETVPEGEAAEASEATTSRRRPPERDEPDEPADSDVVEVAPSEPDLEAAANATTEAEVVEKEALNDREYRKIYATVYQPMTKDQRAAAAGEAEGSHLMALCFDPDPLIVHAIVHNSRAGLDHARMIALHHRTHVGLETVAKRSDYLADALIQRRLLRNPQLPGTILNRMVNPKMLMEVYKIGIDREIPERSRVMTREILRKKFMVSSSDEKAALLFKTEGRCLILLINCSLDSHATQILCSKQNYTIMFIQNLARWSATPPALLLHLLKNPVVRRNIGIKKMLLKHPNTPSEAKRNFGM